MPINRDKKDIMKRKGILLLNPPGKELYIRDYYCSKVSQADYIGQPVDFLFLSGRLAQKYPVKLLDAIVQGLSTEDCLKAILNMEIDTIIFLTGSVSWDTDRKFISKLREEKPLTLIGIGDIFLENGVEKLEKYNFIDAVLLDFSTDDILRYLDGDYEKLQNMIFRKDGKIISAPCIRQRKVEFELPMPRHEMFRGYNYRHPFVQKYPFASILTDFGCLYRCSFCVMGVLGFKYRSVESVMEEIRYVYSLGIREIFFVDQSFGAIKSRNQEMCELIIKNNLRLSWFCFSRVDLVDEDFLKLMKRAGCHTIIFGVETASEEMLNKYNKCYTKEQVKEAFRLCRKLDIKTAATFIFGLPEETKQTFHQTIEFAMEIGCDYASFNMAVPRMGTELRTMVLEAGLIDSNFDCFDQSGSEIAMPTIHLSRDEVCNLKKKGIRKFYFRPSYIWCRIRKIKSFFQFKNQLLEGWALFRRNFFKRI